MTTIVESTTVLALAVGLCTYAYRSTAAYGRTPKSAFHIFAAAFATGMVLLALSTILDFSPETRLSAGALAGTAAAAAIQAFTFHTVQDDLTTPGIRWTLAAPSRRQQPRRERVGERQARVVRGGR